MNKRIFIIGNTNGLPGVNVDVKNFKDFFKSAYGGLWNENEIITKTNMTHSDALIEIQKLKDLKLDYLIVVFSGHGGQERETVLELNASGELLAESRLTDIATRQLNIFDCCRAYSETLLETRAYSEMFKAKADSNATRVKYENRILQAIPQQVSLYACSIGECSYDSAEGGVYSKFLLTVGRSVQSEDFKLVGTAHEEASILTTRQESKQHPDARLPRCLSSQQLILSIKPVSPIFL